MCETVSDAAGGITCSGQDRAGWRQAVRTRKQSPCGREGLEKGTIGHCLGSSGVWVEQLMREAALGAQGGDPRTAVESDDHCGHPCVPHWDFPGDCVEHGSRSFP